MSLSGGVTFFEQNQATLANGASVAASTNTNNANLMLGKEDFFKWQSAGSDDTTTETITITLSGSPTISRLFIIGHNMKDFEISVTGSSITGLNSGFNSRNNGAAPLAVLSGGDIDQDDYDVDVSYYEFDAMTVDEIVITCLTTQIADAEKFISRIIATTEIGTLLGYPEIKGVQIDPNETVESTISGYDHIERGVDVARFNMTLKTHPYQADIDLLDTLFARAEPFLVWLCGGLPDQFRLQTRGWRAKDVYNMKMSGAADNGYKFNVYTLGAEQRFTFREVV